MAQCETLTVSNPMNLLAHEWAVRSVTLGLRGVVVSERLVSIDMQIISFAWQIC